MPAPREGNHLPMPDFARRVVVAVLVCLLLLSVAAVVCWGINVLLEAFAGVLFGLFLSTLSEWVRKHTRLSSGWSLAVVVVGLLVLTGGVGCLLASRLSHQVAEMTQKLPQSFRQLQNYLEQTAWGRQILERLPEAGNSLLGAKSAASLMSGLSSFLVATVVILFVGVFGAAEPDQYKEGLFHLVPPRHRRRAGEAVDAVIFNLRWWLMGQIFLMIVIGVTTTLGLWLIGVPLALTLGIIAGLFELVPYAGPWLSAVPAALIALLISPTHLVAVLGLYLFLHMLEGYVLLPLVQQRAVHLPPALTLVAQVLLGELLGLHGLFVAAPLTVAAVVLLKMLYVEDTLGDQEVEVPGEAGAGKAETPARGVTGAADPGQTEANNGARR